jgi:hypothetical protein
MRAVDVGIDKIVVVAEGQEREVALMCVEWLVLSWHTVDNSSCVLCNIWPPRMVCRVKT